MELKVKGFLRQVSASCASLSTVSRTALWGVAILTVVIACLCVYRGCSSGQFEIVPAASSAIADELPTDAQQDGPLPSEGPEGTGAMVVVHVGGCVQNPGVYSLPAGNRLDAFIQAAGGFSEEANADGINLARLAIDGEHIIVPSKSEPIVTQDGLAFSDGLVHLNTADVAELTTLDGIGEVLARRIIAYRTKIGGFTSIRQLKEVSGIGDKRFEAIKDAVCL